MGSRVTMTRLARELGVSVSTISNAYHRPEKLSPARRRSVLDAAAALGYPGPDPLARRAAGGIGLVFTDDLAFAFSDPASAGFLSGVADVLTENDQHLVLLPAGTPDRRRRAAVDRVAVDGVLVHSLPDLEPTLDLLRRRGGPVVVVDQPGPVPGLGWVGLDETAGMRQLGVHLRQQGHTRVGVISSRLATAPYAGPATERRWRNARYAIPRHRIGGLVDGLGHHVEVEERWNVTEADGADAAAALLRRAPALTAVVCLADTYALGVLEWARRHHVEVPRHLCVAGHDDIPRAAAAGLTTVAQPFADKGRAAASLLLQQVAGDTTPVRRTLPTRLVRRSSTAGPGPR